MIRFYALGGLGEIGKNLYVLEKMEDFGTRLWSKVF